ncbi:hypothetical protein, partial [Paraburkholderia elongata]|uniref:hypothetical protein n=1 Tax=Paraburkholderia elongata TaxID=2675747 RepID=UPI001C131075
VKRLHADDSADSRVKVGNRQAPQQQQKPHPEKVGFLRLRRRNGHKNVIVVVSARGLLTLVRNPARQRASILGGAS